MLWYSLCNCKNKFSKLKAGNQNGNDMKIVFAQTDIQHTHSVRYVFLILNLFIKWIFWFSACNRLDFVSLVFKLNKLTEMLKRKRKRKPATIDYQFIMTIWTNCESVAFNFPPGFKMCFLLYFISLSFRWWCDFWHD